MGVYEPEECPLLPAEEFVVLKPTMDGPNATSMVCRRN
jgi:hypothetical protein